METDEILFKLYVLSGKSKKAFIDHIELGKSSVYDVLKMEDKYQPSEKKTGGKNHSIEFIRSWISVSRPSEPLALLEWLSLVVQLLLDKDDLDLLLESYTSKNSVVANDVQPESLSSPHRATSLLPSIFGHLLNIKRTPK
jgi:hypothetical protein